jgi:hypothetical protein
MEKQMKLVELKTMTYRNNSVTLCHRIRYCYTHDDVRYYRHGYELTAGGKLIFEGIIYDCEGDSGVYEVVLASFNKVKPINFYRSLLSYLQADSWANLQDDSRVQAIMATYQEPLSRSEVQSLIDNSIVTKYTNFVDCPRNILEVLIRQFLTPNWKRK